jgi:hypothetical protein
MSHHHEQDLHQNTQCPMPMAFHEKAGMLLEHWIRHNDEHAQSYRQWAAEFRQNSLGAAALLLESAAELIAHINQTLHEAAEQVASAKP